MRKLSNLRDINHLAVMQTAFIGDTALSLYLPDHLKKINPGMKITLICTPKSAGLANAAKCVDQSIVFDKRYKNSGLAGIKFISKQLDDSEVDFLIVLHRSLRSTLTAFYAKKSISAGYHQSALSFLYDYKVPYKFHFHETDRIAEFLKIFGPEVSENFDAENPVSIEFDKYDIRKIEGIINEKNLNNGYYIVAPGSVWPTKEWPENYYTDLIKKLDGHNLKPVLTGSNSDKKLCERVSFKTGAVDLSGLTSIGELLYLISRAGFVISNDSAPVHFARITGTPSAAIFGPTSPIFGFSPPANSIVLENSSLGCRPCEIHGSKSCPLNTHVCMKSVTAEDVYYEILEKFIS